MGSFNTTCALTRSIIDSSTEVVMVMMTNQYAHRRMPVHSWDLYAPIPILFEGTYNSYGSIKDVNLFQSMPLLDEKELKEVEKILVQDLKSVMAKEKDKALDDSVSSLNDLFSEYDLAFVKKNMQVEIAKAVVKQHAGLAKDPESEKLFGLLLNATGYKSIEEAQEYIKQNEGTVQTVPISFMMMRKDAFMKLMNEYGSTDVANNNSDEDEEDAEDGPYAITVQKQRQNNLRNGQNETMKEMRDFLTKPNSFAGANCPIYTYEHVIKGIAKKAGKVREDMVALSNLHCLDITLLNDYFTVLGIPFQPTMYVSEEIKYYGHKEAFEMQQSLLSAMEPKKKPSP